MLIFAISALEKAQNIPAKVWTNIGIGILVFIVALFILKQVARMNRIWLCIIIFVALTMVGFQWVYSRNEPKCLTPLIDKIAPFFPSESGSRQNRNNRSSPDEAN